MSAALNQLVRARGEAESSLLATRSSRAQWLAATNENNPTNLTRKDIEHQTKAFQNRLLSLKWDCEDLEELVNDCETSGQLLAASESSPVEPAELRQFLAECKSEIRSSTEKLEAYESSRRLFSKHGIVLAPTEGARGPSPPQPPPAEAAAAPLSAPSVEPRAPVAHIASNPMLDEFERNPLDVGEIHFDKTQVERSTTIFENSLYDHFESQAALFKGNAPHSPVSARQVFNKLSRPQTSDVYMNPNENEMILEMLEPEYRPAPAGLLAKARHNYAIRRLFDTERHKFLGTVAIIFSFPILLLLFLAI